MTSPLCCESIVAFMVADLPAHCTLIAVRLALWLAGIYRVHRSGPLFFRVAPQCSQ